MSVCEARFMCRLSTQSHTLLASSFWVSLGFTQANLIQFPKYMPDCTRSDGAFSECGDFRRKSEPNPLFLKWMEERLR